MSLQPVRRTAVLVLLAAVLLVPGAASAAPRSASPSFLPRLWSLLTAIIWPDEGCGIDPDGRCKGATASTLPASADEGCLIDPNGRCTSGH
jgi:hypothetical protein